MGENLVDAKVFSIKYKRGDCSHKTVELDMETRQVICDTCKRVIDPFDFLYSCAVEESIAIANFQHLTNEVRKLQAQVAKLKQQKVFLTPKPPTQ